MLELTDGIKALLKETAERLKGHERRRFMAQTVEELGIHSSINEEKGVEGGKIV